MGKYGKVAIDAADILISNKECTPSDAWKKISEKVFSGTPAAMTKPCPREAFFGLCDAGMLNGIAAQNTSKLGKNRGYAVKAIELLLENPSLAKQGNSALWQMVKPEIQHNQQMDVVLSLWNEGYIKGSPPPKRKTNQ